MPPSKPIYDQVSHFPSSLLWEDGIEYGFNGTLQGLRYEPSGARPIAKGNPQGERGGANQYRPKITDRATQEQNFREKFEALNRVRLTEGEFAPSRHQRRSPFVR